MGLEQGARTSFGEQSRRPVIKPPPRRLPWFEGGLVGVLGFVGAHGMLPDRVFAQSLPQSTENTRLVTAENPAINPLTLELSSRVTQEIVKPLVNLGLDIDVTGELLTNAFLDQEGNINIVYRNVWFQVGMDGRLKVVNVLDKLSKQGLDDKLDFGLFGDPTPPKQDIAIEVGTEIREFLQSLKQVLDIGPVVGYRNYGPFEVYRTSNVALMRILEGPQANTFQLTNTGYQALVAELFPKEYALSPLPFATGGGTETQPQPRLILETLQTGQGKQTEWVLQKSPDSPITPVVQRPDALAHVADTYLPKGNLKKVKINFLPAFEGFGIYNGLDFSSQGTSIPVTDSIYGPAVFFKVATVQDDDTLEIYFSPSQEKGYESLPIIQQGGHDMLDKVNNGISIKIGELITEAGGYPLEGAGRVAPEAWAMRSDDNKSAAIKLVLF